MATKWAPGPWFVLERPTWDGKAMVVDGPEHRRVRITCEGTEANLIATAPELYQMLDNLVGLAKARGGRLHEYGSAIADAEAALAKARGEDS